MSKNLQEKSIVNEICEASLQDGFYQLKTVRNKKNIEDSEIPEIQIARYIT